MKKRLVVEDCEKIGFEEATERFLDEKTTLGRSSKTIECYTASLKQFGTSLNDCEELNSIKRADIILFEKKMKEKGLSFSGVNHHLRAIRAFLRWAHANNYIDHQVEVPMVKGQEVPKAVYSEEELLKLLKKPKSKDGFAQWRTWAIINWILGTGNRISTIINIKMKDIDIKNGEILIEAQKNKKASIVPMDSSLKEVLSEYIKKCRKAAKDEDYLFCSIYGDMLTPNALKWSLRKYNQKRGVDKTSAHALRHTFCKMYVMNGGDLVRLQRLLGHSTLEMSRHYVNLYGADLKVGYDEMSPLRTMYQAQGQREPKKIAI